MLGSVSGECGLGFTTYVINAILKQNWLQNELTVFTDKVKELVKEQQPEVE